MCRSWQATRQTLTSTLASAKRPDTHGRAASRNHLGSVIAGNAGLESCISLHPRFIGTDTISQRRLEKMCKIDQRLKAQGCQTDGLKVRRMALLSNPVL